MVAVGDHRDVHPVDGTGGPRFPDCLHTPQRERVPRPCVFCKGGYDAVCSMRVSCSQKRQRRLLWYPPFAKYAKDGAPTELVMSNKFKARPAGQDWINKNCKKDDCPK